jgi:hypothetical protein
MATANLPHHQDILALQKSLDRAFREQLLLLNSQFCVMAASPSFYSKFHTEPEQTLGKISPSSAMAAGTSRPC